MVSKDETKLPRRMVASSERLQLRLAPLAGLVEPWGEPPLTLGDEKCCPSVWEVFRGVLRLVGFGFGWGHMLVFHIE
jgi:hypothetical protein